MTPGTVEGEQVQELHHVPDAKNETSNLNCMNILINSNNVIISLFSILFVWPSDKNLAQSLKRKAGLTHHSMRRRTEDASITFSDFISYLYLPRLLRKLRRTGSHNYVAFNSNDNFGTCINRALGFDYCMDLLVALCCTVSVWLGWVRWRSKGTFCILFW